MANLASDRAGDGLYRGKVVDPDRAGHRHRVG
jgi:hypothetical protein